MLTLTGHTVAGNGDETVWEHLRQRAFPGPGQGRLLARLWPVLTGYPQRPHPHPQGAPDTAKRPVGGQKCTPPKTSILDQVVFS